MAAQIDIPALTRRVDSNLQTIVSSAWARRMKEQWWRRVVKTRGSTTGVEMVQWLLETAKLRPLGQGGRNVYSDMMAASLTIENEEYGASLKLKWIELLNALGATQYGSQNKLDIAASWAREVGAQGADWPQLKASEFLKGVRPVTAYDGQPFFSESHPVNHVADPTGANVTFANVFYGMPLTGQNYAAIGAYIESIPGPDGRPRKVKPRIVLSGAANNSVAVSMFDARSVQITDPNNPAGTSPATNMIRTLYGTEAPIIDADLDITGAERGTWWIAAELQEDDQLAGMIFQERLPFTLKSLADLSDAQLLREDSYEWKFTGWSQFAAGHPFLLHKVVPTVPAGKTQWTPP